MYIIPKENNSLFDINTRRDPLKLIGNMINSSLYFTNLVIY